MRPAQMRSWAVATLGRTASAHGAVRAYCATCIVRARCRAACGVVRWTGMREGGLTLTAARSSGTAMTSFAKRTWSVVDIGHLACGRAYRCAQGSAARTRPRRMLRPRERRWLFKRLPTRGSHKGTHHDAYEGKGRREAPLRIARPARGARRPGCRRYQRCARCSREESVACCASACGQQTPWSCRCEQLFVCRSSVMFHAQLQANSPTGTESADSDSPLPTDRAQYAMSAAASDHYRRPRAAALS